MAFFGKLGNIVKQVASRQIIVELSASQPSLYQALRYMSSSKLFVGGLSYGTDQQGLREAFAKYGEVIEARVIMDRETGRSRGFGFVTYTSNEEASSAIQALDGQDLHGRRVRVNYATDRQPRTGGYMGGNYGPGGGYGGGNLGYGGGGYGAGGNYGGGYGAGDGSVGSFGNNASRDGYGNSNASSDGFSSGGNLSGNYGSGYGAAGNYGSSTSDFGGAGGAGGSDNYMSGAGAGSNLSSGGFDGNTGFGVAGGADGSDNYMSGAGAGSNLSSGGFNGSSGWEFSGGNQVGSGDGNSMSDAAEGFNQDEQLNDNFKDDDEDPDTNYAKRA